MPASTPPSRLWTPGRIVAAIAALGLAAFALVLFSQARQLWQAQAKALNARLVDAPLDLSRPGQFTFDLAHFYPRAHAWRFLTNFSSSELPEASLEEKLKGFTGRMEVQDREGRVVASAESQVVRYSNRDDQIGLFEIRNFLPKGDYRVMIEITGGAAALAGVPQKIEAAYMICGCETIPALFGTAFGIVCLIVALLVAARLLWGIRKARRHVNTSEGEDASSPS